MSKPDRILIVSASIGTGHTQAARAIEEYWAQKNPDAIITHVDFLNTNSFSFDNLIKETYIKMIDVFPMLYDVIYRMSQGDKKGSTAQTALSWMLKRRMLKLINREKPDIIIFTHPFPCGAACILKRQHLIDVPLVAVITDFQVHQFWVYKQIDAYFVGTTSMVDELCKAGIPVDKITITGIPVRRTFYEHRLTEYKHAYPVKVLIMGGGLGLGCVESALQHLDEVSGIDELIVITGRNAELYEGLMSMRKNLRTPTMIYGYTLEVAKLMREAAMLVTKPGGLTCMEAVTVGVPMVFFSAIPGQEEGNAAFFEQQGFARWVRDIHNLHAVVTGLLANPERLHEMSREELHWKLDGAANIVRAVQCLLDERKKPVGNVNTSVGDEKNSLAKL